MSTSADIRTAQARDGAALAAIYAPAVTERSTSFEIDAPDADEMARRVERITARTPWLVCTRDDEVVGYAYATQHRERLAYQWSLETSAYVRSDAHRCGVARALYTSLFAVLELQGFRNVYAGVTLPNAASVGLHESLGFTRVGVYHGIGNKFGEWHDVMWLERAIAPRIVAPPAPVPLPACDGDKLERAVGAGLPLLRLSDMQRASG